MAMFTLVFAGNVHAPVRVAGIEKKKDLFPSHEGVRDRSVLIDQSWFQWVNKLLLWLEWKSGSDRLEFRFLCSTLRDPAG